MRLVNQISATTCGQACIATILGVTIDSAIIIVGHSGIVSDLEMMQATGSDAGFRGGVPPKTIVAIQKHCDPNGNREHWTISNRGKTLDPAHITKLWPVVKHMPIDWIPALTD